ncbi:MAG TPA: amino acid adenylation domain-containing protein, partial [Burkholderiaceae bacterium]|nr:amino acid adenylation domain-containing protein [Burkholderiaceae bacterium]
EALPLTPNGKLDRQALPPPDEAAYPRRTYEAPQGEVESLIAGLWQELLGVERVGRHDHFFELGGHSLLAVKLVERLRQAGLATDIRTLFGQPTPAALAAAGAAQAADAGILVPACAITPDSRRITPEMLPLAELSQASIDRIVAAVPGGVANVQDIYALAPLQEGLLFHHLLEQQGDAYLFCTPFRARSRSQLDAFVAALQTVIDRHDILRTAIQWEGLEMPVQVVWRRAPLEVEEVSLDPAEGDIGTQLQARFDPRRYRLDVRRAPMLRLAVAHDAVNQRWVALLLFHHLMDDATARGLIAGEIEALLRGDGARLAAAVPYRHYVARARLGLSRQAHEAFFRQMLGDVDEPTLPFGVPDVQGGGQDLEEATLPVDAALSRRLRAQAHRLGVGASSLFHLAWGRVVGGLSGREDVVFGTVLLGRLQGGPGADRALGMLINTLPLRLDVGETAVREAVRATHARVCALLVHEHAPLSLALRCSGVPAPGPLFSALLNYRQVEALQSPAASFSADHGIEFLRTRARNNYPLTLMADDQGDGFALTVLALPAFSAARICACMHAALESLADLLERSPEAPAHALNILPESERRQLQSFNATDVAFPAGALVHRLFEAQAAAQPDAIAVVGEHARLSFARLNRLANRLAQRLTALGARPDQRIAICAGRSPEMVVALLAVLKSGAAYVPLDPDQPCERLAALLQDCAPLALLAPPALGGQLPQSALPQLWLDELDDPGAACDANPEVAGLDDRHLAYVIYTSGSTGQAKGVMVEHRSVVNFWRVLGLTTHRHVPPCAVVALNAGFFFDMSIKGLSQLLSGHTLVLIPQALRASGGELLDFLARHRVHAFDSTPSQLDGLLAAGLLERSDYQPVSVLLGGEAINPATWHKLRQSAAIRFYNMYGPTECTVDATLGLISELGERPSIGRPIANLRVYVLDPRQRPVPLGVAGEIYLGGAGVARGYLHRPELTAARFLDDPFDTAASARMYRTGDLGRYRPDGTLEYLGRNDRQLKIRGFRIEPGDIEARLLGCENVREAVVLAREDQPGAPRLVAYLVPRGGTELQAAPLRAALARQLPEYMLPSAFVVLPALPLNANGKLDHAALPAPAHEHLAARPYEAPQGPTEQAIARLWQQLLGVDRVGRLDRFFDLGGHSLLAMQLLAKLHEQLGVQLPLGELFVRPVLADLAAYVEGLTRTALPALTPADRGAELPLSLAQQRLWFLDRLDRAAGAAYHMPAGLRLEGRLDRAALQSALDRLVARHESLRTTFPSVEGRPVQRIAAPDQGFPLTFHDLRGLDSEARVKAAANLADGEAHAPFDLSAGPLARGCLLQLAEHEHLLLITQHHIVSDGWSLSVLVREFGALYTAFAKGEPDPLAPPALHYADYAAWQRQWLQGEVLRAQSAYWKKQLGDAPALLELPTDRPRPAQQSYQGASLPLSLPAPLVAQLRRLGRQHGATLFMTLLAGWSALLARFSRQDDVVVGTPVANRRRAETE